MNVHQKIMHAAKLRTVTDLLHHANEGIMDEIHKGMHPPEPPSVKAPEAPPTPEVDTEGNRQEALGAAHKILGDLSTPGQGGEDVEEEPGESMPMSALMHNLRKRRKAKKE